MLTVAERHDRMNKCAARILELPKHSHKRKALEAMMFVERTRTMAEQHAPHLADRFYMPIISKVQK